MVASRRAQLEYRCGREKAWKGRNSYPCKALSQVVLGVVTLVTLMGGGGGGARSADEGSDGLAPWFTCSLIPTSRYRACGTSKGGPS